MLRSTPVLVSSVLAIALYVVAGLPAGDDVPIREKGRKAAERAFRIQSGWIEVTVHGAAGPRQLGAPRSFHIRRQNGDVRELLIVEEWSTLRMVVTNGKLSFECRDRAPRFEIEITAPVPRGMTAARAIQLVGLPDGDITALEKSVLDAIERAAVVSVDDDGRTIIIRRSLTAPPILEVRSFPVARVPPRAAAAARKRFTGKPERVAQAKDSAEIANVFQKAIEEWSKPVFLTGYRSAPLLKRRGLHLPTLGTVTGVLMYQDASMLEIRVALGSQKLRIMAATELKREFIPKDFVRGVRRTDRYEFVVVDDPGARQRFLYWFGRPYSLFCPVTGEKAEQSAMKVIANMVDQWKKEDGRKNE